MTSYLRFVMNAMDTYLMSATVKAMLVTSGYTPDIENDTIDTVTPFEPVNDGTTVIFGSYTAGGITQSISTDIASNEVQFYATGFTITGATLPDVSGVVWYTDIGGDLIAYDAFVDTISVEGSWTYTVPDTGFLAYVGNPGMWTP